MLLGHVALVNIDGLNIGDEGFHTVALHNAENVRHVAFQRNDESEAVAQAGGKVTRGAQHADDGDAYRQPSRLHSRIERVALDNGVKAVPLGLYDLFDQSRGF